MFILQYMKDAKHVLVFVLDPGPIFNPLTALTAELFNWNFHPLEVVSRGRDPQLQVRGNYLDLTKWKSNLFKSC